MVIYLVLLGTICCGFIWMNGKCNEIEKDLAVIKTVLIMKEIMPASLAVEEKNQ